MKRTFNLFLSFVISACQVGTLLPDKLDHNPETPLTIESTDIIQTQLSPLPPVQEETIFVGYIKKCLQIQKKKPEDVILQGHIITEVIDIYRLSSRLVGFPSNELFENQLGDLYIKFLGISPDGQWLVYSHEDSLGDFLTIEGFSWITDFRWATQIRAIPRDKPTWAFWLDDERLVFNFYLEEPIIVNMFTGETEHMYVRYPEFHLDDGNLPLFSQDLNKLIAYRSLPEEPPSIVLWDLPNRREIQRIYIAQEAIRRNLMQVSPNGEQIAVSGALDYFFDPLFLDIFLMDWDGNLEKLTTFKDSGLTTSMIERLQWSPDGVYLAFWLNESLAVYNTVTQVVTDYCLRSSNSMSSSPYWSPNSQQIVFNGYTPDSTPIIVVDIVDGTASEVQEGNYHVIGWMLGTY